MVAPLQPQSRTLTLHPSTRKAEKKTTGSQCSVNADSKIWDKPGEAGGGGWSLRRADVPPLWHSASTDPLLGRQGAGREANTQLDECLRFENSYLCIAFLGAARGCQE